MKTSELEKTAYEIRKSVLKSLFLAGSGHLGASLGLADVFTVLYFHFLNHKAENPEWEKRDRLVLSIGHVAPVLYSSLAKSGYFPETELDNLRKLGSMLQGHPATAHNVPGLETTAGSLGHGLSIAVGMALADKADNKNRKIVSIHGDGELQEGSIWEAAMSAGHYKLNNLISIIDRNNVQIDGKTEDVMQLEPLSDKWKSFGWNVITCNGNNIPDIIKSLDAAASESEKPSVIIAKTKMGAGIKSIENDYTWHGKPPKSKEQLNKFLNELY